uniref:Uncharacterized protein n=1 Tax=Physcomitrium patens TaxID=3218 RepID=A0A2K1IYP7_PHYPA|nr:hypothetical protein PHYPA_024217 [Physcomitrium patens]
MVASGPCGNCPCSGVPGFRPCVEGDRGVGLESREADLRLRSEVIWKMQLFGLTTAGGISFYFLKINGKNTVAVVDE